MALSTRVKNFRNGTLVIKDGTGTPLSMTAVYEDGDLGFDIDKAARIVVRDRGVIVGAIKGDDPVQSGSFTVDMLEFLNTGAATIIDVIEKTGAWAAAISTGGNAYEFFTHTLEFTDEGTDFGDTADAKITFAKCILTWGFKEGERNKISVKFEVYDVVTRTGQA
jgi:hypothetical protein